jgi:3-oxoacyl-[acyl-carrier-protein] synthase II
MNPSRRAAVTGIGLVSPIGSTPQAFWSALLEGRGGARPVRAFDTTALPQHVGCEVEELALESEVRERLLGGRCTRLAAGASAMALAGSGLEPRSGDLAIAVVVGTTMGEVTRFEADRVTHAAREPDARDVASLVRRPLDVVARSLARAFTLEGPLVTVPAACAAGAYAIGLAASLVQRGKVDVALAVGCEAFSRLAFVGFSRMHAMSSDHCRPFSRNRPGLLLGEGAAALVIEAASHASRRGAEVHGWVDGFGLACDAHHVTGPHPEGRGAIRAMTGALSRARVDPQQVDYVNAHGTGTPLNDRTESVAVCAVFGGRAVPVSSIKALTGHTMGAAGAIEAIASLLAMRHGVVPPTWNWVEPDPDCAVDCVPNEPREARLRRVLSNSYAFGGNDASLLLSAAEA